ncbi:hypothetical protein SynWH8103_00687 [Synechococcus sp. WH 8103]|nr:hypothetical protein SynWH8103_00687 [Synechococcus sp. WH 8103]
MLYRLSYIGGKSNLTFETVHCRRFGREPNITERIGPGVAGPFDS